MRTLKFACVLLFLSIGLKNYAQEKESDCDQNFNKAYSFLKEDKRSEHDPTPAIKLLEPCANNGDEYAKLLLANIYERSKTVEDHKKAFTLYKELAKSENPTAMTNLAILYKYGKGCKLNYNKARKWFEKAAALGNDKARYCLGYLYLKGFGNIKQDYYKAVQYFRVSQHTMAKYWLGVCYLNGYGTTKNIQKANELLGTSFDKTNTKANIASATTQKTSDKELEIVHTATVSNRSTLKEQDIIGTWNGKLIQMDWAKKDIIHKIDFALTIQKDEHTGTITSSITANNQVINDDVILLDQTLYFDNTKLTLPHLSYLKELPKALDYSLLSSDIQLKTLQGNTYLTAIVDTYIKKWNEAGAPIRLVLKKEIGFENSNEELSDEALKALAAQEESFIKLYPNPFVNDLIVSYNLEEKANVQVQITDLSGNSQSVLESGKLQDKGEHRYFFNATKLQRGAYIVTVVINGERKTRLIVKK